MPLFRYLKFAVLAVLAVAAAAAAPAFARSVLMISIDGLRADDVSQPDRNGLHIPTLRALAANGVHAKGVRGVLPTLTYPSHTTMITGVYPAKHGIANNVAFDPEGKNRGGWMWYSEDIKVPTLWDTVKAKGGVVASLGWPVSVGNWNIDHNVPEYWRTKIPEDEKLLRAVSTPGMPEEIAQMTGVPFASVALDPGGIHAPMDEARMAWIPAMIERYQPQFTTVHIVTLDGARHIYGTYSPKAKETLENIDRWLATAIEKARATDPELVVAIVSDHGFINISKGLNLAAALADDGLITYDAKGKVASWRAYPQTAGGSAAIILKNPGDKAVEERVRRVLARLAANPADGVEKVIERPEIARLGGTPDASFWVFMKEGFMALAEPGKALVHDVAGRGTHGFSPEHDEMLSNFILSGPGIARKQLGIIDMRDIAPTIGEVLGAPLAHPDGKVIPVMEAR